MNADRMRRYLLAGRTAEEVDPIIQSTILRDILDHLGGNIQPMGPDRLVGAVKQHSAWMYGQGSSSNG